MILTDLHNPKVGALVQFPTWDQITKCINKTTINLLKPNADTVFVKQSFAKMENVK